MSRENIRIKYVLDFCDRVGAGPGRSYRWVDCMILDCQKTFDLVPYRRLIELNFLTGIRLLQ